MLDLGVRYHTMMQHSVHGVHDKQPRNTEETKGMTETL